MWRISAASVNLSRQAEVARRDVKDIGHAQERRMDVLVDPNEAPPMASRIKVLKGVN